MGFQEALRIHLAALDAGRSDFEDTLALIDRFFEVSPTAFQNGPLVNTPDANTASCRIFALGHLAGLSEQQTLSCFGRHYHTVIDDPAGSSHANIRQFMSTGWSGVRFDDRPLICRSLPVTDSDSASEATDTRLSPNHGEQR
ncbi:HopJ type III effector protein [Marinobacter fonticola]|uniref:HopJ type III effector protein n=1 Tax=Marinobacter fonticola TaxID=2603215 RepID=UPI0011E77ED2|nr:HopJ type III effector protein [Marinobacter fonticola]